MDNTGRFKPLDIFRGMTIAFMIIVNTPGSWSHVYPLLLHASWHGFTPTDLVFPSFLFAVGNAMAFVSRKWENMGARAVLLKGFRRAFLIFLIGYLLYWIPFFRQVDGEWMLKPFSGTRIFGVLQRIGLCYAMALPIIYFFNPRKIIYISAGLLLSYWGIMELFGDLSLEGNAALALDLWLIGPDHMYGGEGMPFDPEGLLSTLPAVVNVLGGYLAGLYLRQNGADFEKIAKVLLVGAGIMFVAYLWHPVFPINKKIWTSSYVLLTIGLDCIIIGMIIYFMEHFKNPIHFKVFDTFGKNPLFIYVLSGLIAKSMGMIRVSGTSLHHYLYVTGFGWMGPKLGSFCFAIMVTLICWAVAKWLENRNIYIKI